jgi:hypothetical protein
LAKRGVSQTCGLKPSVKAAILNIEDKVQKLESKVESLQNTVDDIASLLRKPSAGKFILYYSIIISLEAKFINVAIFINQLFAILPQLHNYTIQYHGQKSPT